MISVERLSNQEVRISVKDQSGPKCRNRTFQFAKGLKNDAQKYELPPEDMTIEVSDNGYRLKIIQQNVSIAQGTGNDDGVDYSPWCCSALRKYGLKGSGLLPLSFHE